jgi:hypothetical protein
LPCAARRTVATTRMTGRGPHGRLGSHVPYKVRGAYMPDATRTVSADPGGLRHLVIRTREHIRISRVIRLVLQITSSRRRPEAVGRLLLHLAICMCTASSCLIRYKDHLTASRCREWARPSLITTSVESALTTFKTLKPSVIPVCNRVAEGPLPGWGEWDLGWKPSG